MFRKQLFVRMLVLCTALSAQTSLASKGTQCLEEYAKRVFPHKDSSWAYEYPGQWTAWAGSIVFGGPSPNNGSGGIRLVMMGPAFLSLFGVAEVADVVSSIKTGIELAHAHDLGGTFRVLTWMQLFVDEFQGIFTFEDSASMTKYLKERGHSLKMHAEVDNAKLQAFLKDDKAVQNSAVFKKFVATKEFIFLKRFSNNNVMSDTEFFALLVNEYMTGERDLFCSKAKVGSHRCLPLIAAELLFKKH